MTSRGTNWDASGCAIVGIDHRIRWADDVLAGMLGYAPADLVGVAFEAITFPADRDLDSKLAERLFGGSLTTYQITKRFVRKDQSIIRFDLHASLIRDIDGTVLYGIGMLRNLPAPGADQTGDGSTAESEHDRIRRAILEF
jgi:PAS domain S-box-containing protein